MPKQAKISLEAASATQHSKQGARPAHFSQLTRAGVRARPTAFGAADILAIQRMVGNRAVGRILGRLSSPITERSITIQRNGDPYKDKIRKNMTFLEMRDEEPLYRITPLRKVDDIGDYSQLKSANKFAFGQKFLFEDKYKRIKGICTEDAEDMVVFYYDDTSKKMVISEGNHRMFKLHVDNAGSLLGKIIAPLGDTIHGSLSWYASKEKEKETKSEDEDKDKSKRIEFAIRHCYSLWLRRYSFWLRPAGPCSARRTLEFTSDPITRTLNSRPSD